MSHRVAIVTDSNSGISQKEAKELGIYVIPMPFFVNEKIYFEDIDLTRAVLSDAGRRCECIHLAAFPGRYFRSVGRFTATL